MSYLLKKKLENLINQESDTRSNSVNYFFYYISRIYNFISSTKYHLYNYKVLKKGKFSEVTISIGNITIGGTGKTPFTINLSRKLLSTSLKPIIINKDYGAENSKIPKIVSDGFDLYKYSPEVSDEAYLTAISLLSKKGRNFFREMNRYLPEVKDNNFINEYGIPVIACKNRIKVYKKYKKSLNFNLIILDDAFQHFQVERDIDIVLLDSLNPFGFEKIFPYGLLREPLKRLKRADFIILTGAERVSFDEIELIKSEIYEKVGIEEVYIAQNIEYILNNYKDDEEIDLKKIKNKKILSFCGIAGPNRFIKKLDSLNPSNHKKLIFGDHQKYDRTIIKKIKKEVKKHRPDFIITTSKDIVKLPDKIDFGINILVLEQRLEIEKLFIEKIKKEIERRLRV